MPAVYLELCEGFSDVLINVLFTFPLASGDKILVIRNRQNPEWLPSEEKRLLDVFVRLCCSNKQPHIPVP